MERVRREALEGTLGGNEGGGGLQRCKVMRWHDLAAVHRLRFPLPLNYLLYAVWGCLYAGGLARLGAAPAILAGVANVLLIVGSLSLNVAADMPTDARDRGKRSLFVAADRIGHARILVMSTGELVVAAVLALTIGLVWGRWGPIVCALILITTQLAYNIDPLRLKRRGVLGSVAFGMAPVGPTLLLSYTAVASHIDGPVWLIAAGISLISIGRTVWWAVPDMPADTATGMRTPVVRYGAVRGLALGCATIAGGIIVLGAGMWWRFTLAWFLAGILGHVALLAIIIGSLLRHVRHGNLAGAGRVMARTQPLITVSDAMVAIVAIAS